jgi:hypothetical protein
VWRAQRREREGKEAEVLPASDCDGLSGEGEVYKAWLRRSGSIRFDGKTYDSPSAAGTVARGGKHTNGWVFWQVKQAGKFVRLKEFRR